MLHPILSFIQYYFRADTKYRVHSPSLFRFVNDVLETEHPYYCYARIEQLRAELLANKNYIEVMDLGAGSQFEKTPKRQISKIAATAVSNRSKCQQLHRIANFYNPDSILELGTSLGLSASYLSHVAPTTTIEGSGAIAEIAQQVLDKQQLNTEIITGDIGTVLEDLKQKGSKYDLIFADGNHRKEATLSYFEKLQPLLSKKGVIVFDDIYWSKGMTEAWEVIKGDEKAKRSIDLFTFGIIEMNPDLNPSARTLIKSKYKPFQWGFFSGPSSS